MATLLLIDLLLVAARTILGRDNHGDECAVVLESVSIACLRAVAIKAVDAFLAVRPCAPFFRQRGIHWPVTADAGLAFLRTPRTRRWWREGLGRLSERSRYAKRNPHRASRKGCA